MPRRWAEGRSRTLRVGVACWLWCVAVVIFGWPALVGGLPVLVLLARARVRVVTPTLASIANAPLVFWMLLVFPSSVALAAWSRGAALFVQTGLLVALLGGLIRRLGYVMSAKGLLVLGVCAVVCIRTAEVTQLTVLIPALVTVGLALALWDLRGGADRGFHWIMCGLLIYLIMELVGYYIFGLRSPAQEVRLDYQTSLAVFGSRVLFPFTYSMVTPAIVAGAVAVWSVPRLVYARGLDVLAVCGSCVSLLALLAPNYRAPLLIAALSIVVVLVLPRLLVRVGPIFGLVLLAAPLWIPSAIDSIRALTELAGRQVSFLSRDDDTLESRLHIWRLASEHLRESDTSNQLFGFGPNGRVTSGLATRLDSFAAGFVSRPGATATHASLMEWLVLAGVVGAALLTLICGAALFAARKYGESNWHDPEAILPLAVTLVLVGSSGLEVALVPSLGSFVLWMLILLFVVCTSSSQAGTRVRRAGGAECAA